MSTAKETTFCCVPQPTWVYSPALKSMFGLTDNQIEWTRRQGQWIEGLHYKRDGLNRLTYNWKEIDKWIAQR